MATRKEAEAAKKQQLKDGKKQKDIEKGRKINNEKNAKKTSSAKYEDRNQFIDILNKTAQKEQKEASKKLQNNKR